MRSTESRSSRLPLLLVLALGFGVGPAAGAPSADAPDRLTHDLARALVEEVLPEVEKLRGLSFTREVPVEIVDDTRLRQHVLERLERFDQTSRMDSLQRVYELLGLLPRGVDLVDLLLEVLEEQTGGFYDPGRGAYYLMEDMPPSAAGIFSAHELTHALEDQHFDLDGRLRDALSDDDRLLATTAVHEGSAMLLMSIYTMQSMMRGELDATQLVALAQSEAGKAEKLSDMPPVLIRQLLGPYVLGASFLTGGVPLAALRDYPTEAVNRAVREGPTSSEQILHPEKYWRKGGAESPTSVCLDGVGRLLGKNWRLDSTGVLGELTIGPLVGAPTPFRSGAVGFSSTALWTNAAASGWAGDRWELWLRGERAVVLWLTEWDSVDDALEFEDALPSGERLYFKRAGRHVAIVAGERVRKTPRLLTQMLKPHTALDGSDPNAIKWGSPRSTGTSKEVGNGT